MFAFDAQRFAAGGEDPDARRVPHQFGGYARRLPNDVLAIVQHDQQMPVAQDIDKTGQQIVVAGLEAQNSGEGMRHETGVRNRGKVHQPDTILEDRDRLLCDGERDRVFPIPPAPTIVTMR